MSYESQVFVHVLLALGQPDRVALSVQGLAFMWITNLDTIYFLDIERS